MFGFEIPAWAIGVGFIILAGSLAGGVKRLLSGDHGNPRPRGKLSRRDVGQMVGDLETRLGDVAGLAGQLVDPARSRLQPTHHLTPAPPGGLAPRPGIPAGPNLLAGPPPRGRHRLAPA